MCVCVCTLDMLILELDRGLYGWMMCGVVVMRLVLDSASLMDGVIIIAYIMKMLELDVLLVSIHVCTCSVIFI